MESNMENILVHYGVLGMKWGVRRYQNKDGSLTPAGKARYYGKNNNNNIQVNLDGSKTIPSGFVMNRVGQNFKDINKSGALYVSYGKDDAARYVQIFGPSKLAKLLKTSSDTIQQISAKSNLRMASDKETATIIAELLKDNKELLRSFNDSFYAWTISTEDITAETVSKALADPSGKAGQKLAFGVSHLFGDANYSEEAKVIYERFRQKGYDVIPDLCDRLSGVSNTAMIIINPDKVDVKSYTTITKEVYKNGKDYVKSLDKLPVSDLIK